MSVKYKASELLVRQARREDMAAVAEMIQVGYVCVHLRVCLITNRCFSVINCYFVCRNSQISRRCPKAQNCP